MNNPNVQGASQKLIEDLTSRVAELEANVGFFKCCLLSGEMPKDGAEPYPPEKTE